MMTIKRSCSYRIITRAVNADDRPLVALLTPGADDCNLCLDAGQLQTAVDAQPDVVIVYNQQAEARELVNGLTLAEDQVFIEIRQDTKGVLGLHALRRGKSGAETLELIYQ
jgi:hypothetical protein